MLENINPYNKNDWEYKFKQTDLYAKLTEDFDHISFEHFVEKTNAHRPSLTPRQQLGSSLFSGTIFYYLDYILCDSPEIIYDLGCGWNIFKKYLPIYGYDPYSMYSDERSLPEGFHSKYLISINALHFTSLSNIKDVVTGFYNKIDLNGKGLLTLNTARMTRRIDIDNIDSYIRTELYHFKDNLLVFDLDLSFKDAYLDGNVRMILNK